jgi:glutamate 5-kinase
MSGIPDEIAEITERVRCAWLGVPTGTGSLALPAEWEPGTGRLRVSRDALAAVGASLPGAVCLTMDESTSRRPDEKLGVMLRGTGSVVDVDGSFGAGDAVEVADGGGVLIGKGICNYSASELRRIRGMKSADVREVLPRATEEAVHRDYFVLA